ncbi:MAG TPA: ABC transporter permease [Candidatus Omnitrophota bacterium]|nr:ABC transporter permease [Candidatus Omnitrophota bacterium]HPD84666.1 ABC transporter permease [Candidatus Omnitrophota bacterium]HRZ03524.1 ABC transporter permease [Candidatus Omnitrophota bacterium]
MRKIFSFIKRDFLIDTSYTISFCIRWVGIAISVFMFYYLSGLIGGKGEGYLLKYGGNYFSFVLIGLVAASYLDSAVNGLINSVSREHWSGTLEPLLAVPMKTMGIIFSLGAYNLMMGFLAAGFFLFLGAIFGADFSSANLLSVLVIGLLATVSFLSVGIGAAACIIILKKGDPLAGTLTNLMWLLGGAYFPVTVFPQPLQKLAMFLPSTYVFEGLRLAFLKGYSIGMLQDILVVLAGFAVLLFPLSLFVLKKAIRYTKKRGTIVFA